MHALDDYPCLKAKGHTAAMVSLWLADLLERVQTTKHQRVRCMLFRGLKRAWLGYKLTTHLQDESGHNFELTAGGVSELAKAREEVLLSWNYLCDEAQRGVTAVRPWKPKVHAWDHGIREAFASRITPSSRWAFSDEDWLGYMSRLLTKAHPTTRCRVMLERWLMYVWGEYEEML